ncbi:hypothetical protein C9426_27040 [Serratia sp. S1B]|nr:hypothetical protein C9426_27040 [Serratia sp. S1B]
MSFRLTTKKVLFASSLIMSGYVLTANAEDPANTVQTSASTDSTLSAQTTNNTKAADAEPATTTSTDSTLTEQSKTSDGKKIKEAVKDTPPTLTNVNTATPESAAPSENTATPQQKETVVTPTETTTAESTKTPAVTPSSNSATVAEQPKESDKKETKEDVKENQTTSTNVNAAAPESAAPSENTATPQQKETVATPTESTTTESTKTPDATPAVTPPPTSATVAEQPKELDKKEEAKESQATAEFKLDSEEQKRAYASGIALGHYIEAQIAQQKELHITLDKNIMLAGVADAFNKQEKMSEKEVRDTLVTLDEQIKVLTEDKDNKRIAADKTWMEQFAQREGVKKSKQGLLYLIINKGSGPALQSTDIVELSFKGTLIDGTVVDGPKVDNSYQVFKVENIPPLLRDSVKLIRKGGEIQVAIPPSAIKVPAGSKKPEFVVIYTISVINVNKPQ